MPLDLEIDEIFTGEITETVLYGRGDDEIRIDAVPDESVFEVQDASGAFVEYRSRDFIVQTKDLDFGSGPVPPNRKDTVLLTQNGTTTAYEVMPEFSLKHYRDEDAYGYLYRIHTKEVAS